MDGEPLLDGVADDVPEGPPHSAVVIDSVQELQLGELHGFVETNIRVLLLVWSWETGARCPDVQILCSGNQI